MARPKLRLDLSTGEDKENQHVAKDLKRRSSTDVVAARELQAFQNQVAKLWSNREQDNTSSRGSITSLVDLSNKPLAAAADSGAEALDGIHTPVNVDLPATSSSSDVASQPSASVAPSTADSQIAAGGSRTASSGPKTQICFDFTKGVCTRGNSCKFSHDVALIVSVNSQERGICFDFLRGQCHRGLLCRFSHDLSSLAAQQCQRGSRRNAPICYDFVKGVCARGPECRYSHDINSIINDTRHTSQSNNAAQLCHDYSKGRCARGAACRYSHDFSALTATSPLMPALTAAAAAAAIAQMSLDPRGLLPQLAPYLQPYLSSTTQHASLQQQLLQSHAPNSTLSPHSFPFAKATFAHPGMARDNIGVSHGNSFNMSGAAAAPAFSYSGMNANAMPYNGRNMSAAAYAGSCSNAAPFAGMNANAPGFLPASRSSHNSSLLSQRLQAHHASRQMYGSGQDQSKQGSPPSIAPQKSLPELYGVPAGMSSGGRSLDSARSSFPSLAGRLTGSPPNSVATPPFSPFQALQNMQRKSPPMLVRPEAMSEEHPISKSQISRPSSIMSQTAVETDILPAAAVPSPDPMPSSPQPTHSVTSPPIAVQSMLFVDSQPDTETSQLELTGTLSANAPEFKSIQELCFDAASFGISESGSKVSVVEYDGEGNSSTSEHSSGPGLEASDSGLVSADSEHLFMCQEIWKR